MFHRKPDWRIRLEGFLIGVVTGVLLLVVGLGIAYLIVLWV